MDGFENDFGDSDKENQNLNFDGVSLYQDNVSSCSKPTKNSAVLPGSGSQPEDKSGFPSLKSDPAAQAIFCANDSSQLAIGFCPELNVPLCHSSFEALRQQPALRHIQLHALHEFESQGASRSRDPDTGDLYTMYDLVLEKPIPTVAKLIGSSKANDVCSLADATDAVRTDFKAKLTVLKDQINSMRVASNHIDKLSFTIMQDAQRTESEILEYFRELQTMLESRCEQLLQRSKELQARKQEVLSDLSEGLPTVIEAAKNANDRIQAALDRPNGDLDLLFDKKDLERWLHNYANSLRRLDCSSIETDPNILRSAKIEPGYNPAIVDSLCRFDYGGETADNARCWRTISTLLGDPDNLGSKMSVPKQDSGAFKFDADKSFTGAGATTSAMREKNAFASSADAAGSGSAAFGDAPRFGEEDSTAPSGLILPKSFTFDATYCYQTKVELRDSNKRIIRKKATDQPSVAVASELLGPNNEFQVVVDQVAPLFSSSSAEGVWIGVTPVRATSLIKEYATYLDLGLAEIVSEGTAVDRPTSMVSACEGDVIGVKRMQQSSDSAGGQYSGSHTAEKNFVLFTFNGRVISRPLPLSGDALYPFIQLAGKTLSLRIADT